MKREKLYDSVVRFGYAFAIGVMSGHLLPGWSSFALAFAVITVVNVAGITVASIWGHT